MTTQKIIGYRKLLNVTRDATLKELKTIYRNSMKEDHPDTIADPVERLAAEERSKNIIDSEIKISGKMEAILFISYLPLQ